MSLGLIVRCPTAVKLDHSIKIFVDIGDIKDKFLQSRKRTCLDHSNLSNRCFVSRMIIASAQIGLFLDMSRILIKADPTMAPERTNLLLPYFGMPSVTVALISRSKSATAVTSYTASPFPTSFDSSPSPLHWTHGWSMRGCEYPQIVIPAASSHSKAVGRGRNAADPAVMVFDVGSNLSGHCVPGVAQVVGVACQQDSTRRREGCTMSK